MDFIKETDHRPYPKPDSPWIMYQEWHNLLFAHWPLPPEVIRQHIPADLPLDTFEGQAWIGVVPFRMRWVHPRWLPSVPWLSFFAELNVRTYVKVGEKPGVYFFSLEAANPIAVQLARRFYHLPYYDARMVCQADKNENVTYESARTHRGAPATEFRAAYQPNGAVYNAAPGSLDEWLTERYCLYTHNKNGKGLRGEIHHKRWPLQPATAEILTNSMTRPMGIALPVVEPLLHYVREIQMVAWSLTA